MNNTKPVLRSLEGSLEGKVAKIYSKPKLTKHAHLKSVTFSHALDKYDYEGDDGGSEG